MKKKIKIESLEELINQPREVSYDTYELDELSYTCLLVDIRSLLLENENLKKENEKYNEIISKAIDYIQKHITRIEGRWLYTNHIDVVETLELDNKELVELLKILRGEENV